MPKNLLLLDFSPARGVHSLLQLWLGSLANILINYYLHIMQQVVYYSGVDNYPVGNPRKIYKDGTKRRLFNGRR